MRDAAAKGLPKEAMRHQERARAEEARAGRSAAAAATAAALLADAAGAASERASSLCAFDAGLDKQELLVARLQASVLWSTIQLADGAYRAAMAAHDFGSATAHQKEAADRTAARARLLKAYRLGKADAFTRDTARIVDALPA